jgi:hypothetical protein
MRTKAGDIATVSDSGIRNAKYINMTIVVPDDVAPRLREVCVMFGSGDEAYVSELKEILLRYIKDPNVNPYVEIG